MTPFRLLVVLLLEGNAPVTFSVNHRPDSTGFYTLPATLTDRGSRVVKDTTQDELWKYNVQVIPPEQMKAGDIVFITNDPESITHGGLFIEWVDDTKTEFRFVNASSYWGRVGIDTWLVEGTKRDQWFVGAGRLLVTIN